MVVVVIQTVYGVSARAMWPRKRYLVVGSILSCFGAKNCRVTVGSVW